MNSTEKNVPTTSIGEVLTPYSNLASASDNNPVFDAVFGSLSRKEIHNFRGDKMQVYRLISLATGPRCKSYDDIAGKELALDKFYAHRIELEDKESGELFEVTRVVLIDTAGEAYAFVSDGIMKDLARIIQTFGVGPYNGEIKVKPTAVKTTGGKKVYILECV